MTFCSLKLVASVPGQHLHRLRNPHRLHAHRGHAHQQVNDFFLVVGETVAVEFLADGRVLGFLFLVLVEHPVNGRTVAKLVGPGFGRDAAQRGFAVKRDAARSRIGAQHGLGRQTSGANFGVGLVGARQREGRGVFVTDVQRHQGLAPRGPLPEVSVERNARKLALEIQRVFLAGSRVVQHDASAAEDGLLASFHCLCTLDGSGFV